MVSFILQVSTAKIIINWCFILVLLIYLFSFITMFLLPSIVVSMRLPKIIILILAPIGCICIFLSYYEILNEIAILIQMICYIVVYLFFLFKIIITQKRANAKAKIMLDERKNSNAELFW